MADKVNFALIRYFDDESTHIKTHVEKSKISLSLKNTMIIPFLYGGMIPRKKKTLCLRHKFLKLEVNMVNKLIIF